MTTLAAPAPATASSGSRASAGRVEEGSVSVSVEAVVRAERSFLEMCVALGEAGRGYLDRISDEHLSTGSLRRAREWLLEHFSSPLSWLPDDDPALHAAVTQIVMRAEQEPASAGVLELSFLQLELRRAERLLRAAEREGDAARQRELWAEREGLRERLDTAMKETS